jgi:hypothetical protein
MCNVSSVLDGDNAGFQPARENMPKQSVLSKSKENYKLTYSCPTSSSAPLPSPSLKPSALLPSPSLKPDNDAEQVIFGACN